MSSVADVDGNTAPSGAPGPPWGCHVEHVPGGSGLDDVPVTGWAGQSFLNNYVHSFETTNQES